MCDDHSTINKQTQQKVQFNEIQSKDWPANNTAIQLE